MQEFSCESCGYHTLVYVYFLEHMLRGHLLGRANNSNGILIVKKEWFVEDVR